MTKKERRKLKEFTQSDEWTNATDKQKIGYISYIAKQNKYERKERRKVCKLLLSVVK